jgi:hypothetical protein
MLRKRRPGRELTDVDIDQAIRLALAQAETAAVAVARG